jgi:hypothetical protein
MASVLRGLDMIRNLKGGVMCGTFPPFFLFHMVAEGFLEAHHGHCFFFLPPDPANGFT